MEIAANATNEIKSCYISMNQRLKKILKGFLYVHIFLGLALGLTQCSFSNYADKSYAKAQKEKPFDVIIVPGVPYEKAKTNSVMTLRLYWAKHLYDSGYTKNIIFSGSSVYTHFVEGIAMKIMADSLGIPTDHTFYETKAEHSTENVYYSWKMAKEKGFQKIAVATDPYQSAMLRSFIRRHCPDVKQIPIVFKLLDIDDRSLPKIDTTAAYKSDFVSIMERESFWNRLRGTLGKRVIEDKKIARREKTSASTGN
jgi:vancomycin permeability regulator SanA